MSTEALHPDGSLSIFREGGGASFTGGIAVDRLRLITAKSCLSIYIRTEGRMQMTRNGAHKAIVNVIEPATGKKYPRSMKGKKEALADCEALIARIEADAIIIEVNGG